MESWRRLSQGHEGGFSNKGVFGTSPRGAREQAASALKTSVVGLPVHLMNKEAVKSSGTLKQDEKRPRFLLDGFERSP